MVDDSKDQPATHDEQRQQILDAARHAVRDALRRHMLLGESVAVAGDNGQARIIDPEEIGRALGQDVA